MGKITNENVREKEQEEVLEIPVLLIDGTSNIKYEAPNEFQTSVLYNAYSKAFQITSEIIMRNEMNSGTLAREGQGTALRNREQIYNIIAFMGDRGTGKTSAMLSYMEFLKDYYRNTKKLDREWMFNSSMLGKDDYMFTGIEYIDASALNNKEDILGSVLSKMLKKWTDEDKHSYGEHGIVKKNDYEYKKRQIRMKFSKVYDSLKDLRSEKDILDKDSDMYLETLEKLTLTLNVKQSFQELVEDFLDIMTYPGSENRISKNNHFLVISIDDLDMNVKSGFLMLEQIRLYLMVPNVIVLLSANYEQLEKICYNHYINEFNKSKKDDGMKEHIAKLSREYLEKMIPIQRQVCFKSGKKWDFFDRKKLTVKYTRENHEEIACKTLQEIISMMYVEYFGVRFGKRCIYYLQPDTLREVCSWINQINTLITLRDIEAMPRKKDRISAYEENMKWFWDNEFPQFCKKYFNINIQKIFASLDTLEFEGQLKQIRSEIKEIGREGEPIGLQETLAKAGEGNMEEHIFSYGCVIYYTMKLAYLVKKLKWIETDKEKQAIVQEILQYFAKGKGGIWGSWENTMLYPLLANSLTEPEFIYIARTEFNKGNSCLSLPLEGSISDNKINEFARINEKRLRAYQYILLFYRLHDIDYENTIWRHKPDSNDTLELAQEYIGVFSLSNFVLNILEGCKIVGRFIEDFSMILALNGVASEQTDEVLKRISIIGDLVKYENETLLPLYDMEYLIETGKQMHEQLGRGSIRTFEDDAIKYLIKEYFDALKYSLEKYDKEHETIFKQVFEECPLIKNIYEDRETIQALVNAIKANRVASMLTKEE